MSKSATVRISNLRSDKLTPEALALVMAVASRYGAALAECQVEGAATYALLFEFEIAAGEQMCDALRRSVVARLA
jgi:hypothetical protein